MGSDLDFIVARLRRLAVFGGGSGGRSKMSNAFMLVRAAMSLGCFAGAKFKEFRDFFDPRHDSNPKALPWLSLFCAADHLAENADLLWGDEPPAIRFSRPKNYSFITIPNDYVERISFIADLIE